jgi:VanZ family protein
MLKKEIITNYPLSITLIIAIWILCLIPLPETPLDNVKLMDKWVHFVMFGSIVLVLCFENRHKLTTHSCLLFTILSIMMGAMVELAQKYLTAGIRNGDFLDFIADAIGAIIALTIVLLIKRFR